MRVLVLGFMMLGALGACVPAQRPSEDFATYCAACHGARGLGDGPAVVGLAKKPADLTRLSARNGGVFPTTRVMSQIWGYAGGKGHGVMPEFAPLMVGEKVLFDGGDGIATPTPERLVALAEYLKRIQR